MRQKLKLKFKKVLLSHQGQIMFEFEDMNRKPYYWRTESNKIFPKGVLISCTATIKGDNHLFNVRSIKIKKDVF